LRGLAPFGTDLLDAKIAALAIDDFLLAPLKRRLTPNGRRAMRAARQRAGEGVAC
jgi:hypothetical protein